MSRAQASLLLCGVLALLAACGDGTRALPRNDADPTRRDHSDDPTVQAAIDACWQRHEAELAALEPAAAPTHTLDCDAHGDCRLLLAPDGPVGRAGRLELTVRVRVDGIPRREHPAEPDVRIEVLERTHGYVYDELLYGDEAALQLSPGRYDVWARFDNAACAGLPAGHRKIAENLTLTHDARLEVDLRTDHVVTVAGKLALDAGGDAELQARFDRAFWAIALLPAGDSPRRTAGRFAHAVITDAGPFALEALPGTYDLAVAYLAPYEVPEAGCDPYASPRAIGYQHIAEDVAIREDTTLSLTARPIIATGRLEWLTEPPPDLLSGARISLWREPEREPAPSVSHSLALQVASGEAFEQLLWPGTYDLDVRGTEHDHVVLRLEDLALDQSGPLPLTLGRYPVRASVPLAPGLPKLGRFASATLVLSNNGERGGSSGADEMSGGTVYTFAPQVWRGTYEASLSWGGALSLHDVPSDDLASGSRLVAREVVVDGEVELGALRLPETVALGLELRRPGREYDDVRIWLDDPVLGARHRMLVPRGLDARLETHVFAGVYDVYWDPAQGYRTTQPPYGWRVASCRALEGPRDALVLRPDWRSLSILVELPDGTKLEDWTLDYRLLARPGEPPWRVPLRRSGESGSRERVVELLPGRYELTVDADRLVAPIVAIVEVP